MFIDICIQTLEQDALRSHVYIQFLYVQVVGWSLSSYGSTAQFGPWPPLLGFRNNNFLRGWIVSPAPHPQPGGPGLRIYDPGDRVAQL
jgi:hypothetical protein